MKKLKRLTALLSAAAMAVSMLGTTASAESSSEKTIAEIVSGMTTKQKVEQMIMITLRPWKSGDSYENVTSLNEHQKKLIEEHNFAGVCLFAANIESIEQTAALTAEIQQAALKSDCGIPMLIAADQEGGRIYRLTTGTPTAGNMALGATGDPDLAEESAKILGSEISALGINTDFGPVVDINNNPSNPVINTRSFSSDPDLVSEMGVSYIKGLQSVGVIATCKHFPGHGDTATDSHTGLPLINKSYDELKKLELVPYSAVCEQTDMIMTAHIQFPQIEKETYTSISTGEKISLPATLSKTMITDVLRGDYGFDGVVTTDAMVMNAINENFDIVDAAALAINADVDIILEPVYIQTPEDITKTEKYINDIVARVEKGDISIETINKSVTRILTMKKERGILDYKAPDTAKAKQIVGSLDNREKALQIAEKAITLVKNDDDLLPLDLGDEGSVAYFYPYANVENTMHFALDRLKKDGIVSEGVTADCILYRNHKADEFEENIKNADAVIAVVEMYGTAYLDKTDEARGWQAAFVDDLIELAHKNDKKVIFLSANMPYDVARFQEADAILAAYCANGMDALPVDGKENPAYGVNYPAALITILGGNSPTGRLPVDIYGIDEKTQYTDEILYDLGFGLEYKSEKTDISYGDVTVDTKNKTVTVTVDGETVPESEYHVIFFTYEKTEDGESLTRVGTDFPTEEGTYIAAVVANEDSAAYIGENRSEPFTVADEKTDISYGDVTVDTDNKTVTVTVDGETVPESEYHVIFFTYEKTEDGESLTRVGTDFPTEEGTYIAAVVANEDSAAYIGENRSEPFTISAAKPDTSSEPDSQKSDEKPASNPVTGAGLPALSVMILAAGALMVNRKKKK